MSKFTPGPWKLEYDNNEEGQQFNCGPASISFPYNNPAREAEAQANAQLIATAPEMYEALKAYAECSDGCTCGDGWGHEAAIEALRKADGGTQ